MRRRWAFTGRATSTVDLQSGERAIKVWLLWSAHGRQSNRFRTGAALFSPRLPTRRERDEGFDLTLAVCRPPFLRSWAQSIKAEPISERWRPISLSAWSSRAMSSDSARRKARQATTTAIAFRAAFDRLRASELRRKALIRSGSSPVSSMKVMPMVISLARSVDVVSPG